MKVRQLGIVLSLVWVLTVSTVQADAPPDDDAIARAIAEGIEYLKTQQNPSGTWSFSFHHRHELGMTALAGLALLENGVPRDDSAIVKAESAVRELAPRSNQNYDLSLAILFLTRLQDVSRGDDDDLIHRLAARLSAGEQSGSWTYTVPVESESGSRRGGSPSPFEGLRAPSFRGPGDNSNTQFSILGLWAAARLGFDANAPLEAVDAHFRGSQNRDGGWGYRPNAPSSEAMTCAGLMGLAIAAARPERAERYTARARGAELADDPAFQKALEAVTRHARAIGSHSEIYYLWSLERVCVALGLRELDGLDWYAVGARELLRRQEPSGAWPRSRWGALPDTCLALLFLRKANLAFELDRVLRLPDPERDARAQDHLLALAEIEQATVPEGIVGDDDVAVLVTGADESNFPEIALTFEVKNPDGSFRLDARQDDFRVTEYGQDVPIVRFEAPRSTEAHPTTVVLVVDRSLSMIEEDRIGALKQAVPPFLEGLPEGSRVAVIAFSSDVELICPFTTDKARVQEAVEALTPSGATRYYDAVAEALELIAPQSGRRAVLAMTDGEDTFSQSADLNSVIQAAQRLGLPVHTLGLGTEDEIESDALRRLAVSTRGQYYPAREAHQLRGIYEELAERLRSSYRLVYRSDRRLPDGTLRPVRVYYRASEQAGEAAVYIPGMVVPATGWSGLFVALVLALGALALLPGWLGRKVA